MRYTKSAASIGGAWIKGSEILDQAVSKLKIVGECLPTPSSFKDKRGNPKTQDVCQVLIPGDPEKKNLSVNMISINGMVDAFGEDSLKWVNRVVQIKVKKRMIGDEVKYPIYLIPEGYELTKDEYDNDVIQKIGAAPEENKTDNDFIGTHPATPTKPDDAEITVEDIPF